MDGIGGDLFVLYWDAEDRRTDRAERIRTRAARPVARIPSERAAINTMPPAGIHTVTVPGAVDGWAQMHKRYGKLPWEGSVRIRHRLCRARLPGDRSDPGTMDLADILRTLHRATPESRACSCPAATRRGRATLFRNPGSGAAPTAALAAAGSRRFLQRRDRRRHSEDIASAWAAP